ncbi:hypothetical protein F4781DRAFT_134454 [Annulohypoxylon bovei var. microspora]|nr:hypothetical protein F4781DRAFT_134454 [Annulohypoxylon bovei var. microspora]
MAKNQKPTTEPSSLHSSLPEIFEGKRLQRRLVRIPTDQHKLLGRQESWATFLSNCPKRFLNVPPDVLESLKKCHARQSEETQPEEAQPEEPEESEEITELSQSLPNPQSDDGSQDGKEGSPAPSFQSQPDDCDERNPASWPSSPPEHKHPPQRVGNKEAPPQFVTQLPPVSSPRPTEPTRLTDKQPSSVKRHPLPPFPSSNPEEEPLEVEVPTAIDDSIPPVNKSAVPTFATPPSAQIVPCTYQLSEPSSVQQEVKPKQRIYKPVTEFYRPTKSRPASTHLNCNAAQIEHTDSPTTDIQSSMSTINTSSSIIPSTIPSTIPGEALVRDIPGWHVNPTTSPSKESHVSHEEPDVQNSPQVQCHSPEYKPRSPPLISSPPALPIPQTRPPIVTHPDLESQAPFVRYTVTYPTYNGTINDFVTACMYIQLQQRRIRTSLYDDFIRAWHEGYVSYVRDCDDAEPPVKVLNAIEWFNGIDDDQLFTSRVITKQNLQSTLDHYPDELRSAQELLGLTPSQAQEVTSTPDAVLLVKGHRPASKNDDDIDMDEDSSRPVPSVSEPAIVENSSSSFPAVISTQQAEENRKVVPLQKSLGEIEKRPAATKVFARSFSDVSRHKRKASEELGNDVPKRLSVNALPRSPTESIASFSSSIAASSTAGSKKKKKKNKFADDAKLAKSLQRWREKREKERIASSAPVSNTPTSAQRE